MGMGGNQIVNGCDTILLEIVQYHAALISFTPINQNGFFLCLNQNAVTLSDIQKGDGCTGVGINLTASKDLCTACTGDDYQCNQTNYFFRLLACFLRG